MTDEKKETSPFIKEGSAAKRKQAFIVVSFLAAVSFLCMLYGLYIDFFRSPAVTATYYLTAENKTVSSQSLIDPQPPEKKTELVCPQCSWRESQLNSSGRLGCENCYKVFSSLLNDALKKMHHGSSHVGKHPSGKGTELGALHCELARLQKRLQQAIAEENYEEAAILRDKIRSKEGKVNE